MTRLGLALAGTVLIMGPALVLLGALWIGDVLASRAARRNACSMGLSEIQARLDAATAGPKIEWGRNDETEAGDAGLE